MARIGVFRGLNMRSLRARLLFLILIGFFPVTVVSTYVGWEYRNREIARIQQDVLSLARLAANDHEELILRDTPPLLKLLATLYPEVRAQDGVKSSVIFARLLAEYPQYINIMAAKVPGGDVFASGIPLRKPLNLADRPLFARILRNRNYVVGEFALGKATGKPTLVCGYPVFDSHGKVRSVIMAGIDVERLAKQVAASQPNRDVLITILDRNGTILIRTKKHDAWVGKDVSRTGFWAAILRAKGEGTFRGPGFDGMQRLSAFKPLIGATGAGNGYVVASITEEAVVAQADRFMRYNLFGLAIGTALALLGGLVVGHRSILRNVDSLVRSAERLAEGDLRARTGMSEGTGEFLRLASTFDMMAEKLLQRETAQKIAEKALFDEKERLMVTLRSIGDGVITTDNAGRVVLLNDISEKLTGWSQEEAAGRPLEEVFHIINEITRELCVNPVEKVLQTGAIVELANHTALISKDGRELVIADSGAPICDRDGTIIGVVLVFRDITERVQTEKEILRLNTELEQRVVERTAQLELALQHAESFSYTISHDLRAPLRAIDGYANIILEDHGTAIPAPAQEILQQISRNIRQMGRLIDALLAFSRFSLLSLIRQPVNSAGIVQEVLADLKNELANRRVDIHVADLPVCQADPVLLRQVFHNLIANAFKYTRQRPLARIEIGAKDVAGRTTYYVRDNGVGFDMKYVSKLFGVFQRLHRPEEFEGTGVGLAIVQNIVHRHGGTVWAEGKEDQGATFYFTIDGNG
ncbi:MAG: multi-sensor signal transduction histidine [Geobacteraceae bacterium]|nr:MAG: multi-sensor signal transduction histidine [Geobacteraceae bacterium]